MTTNPDKNTAETQARRLERLAAGLEDLISQPRLARRWRASRAEAEWSAGQIAGHLVEMIPYWLHHCRTLMAARDSMPQFGRTLDAPERLAGVESGAQGQPEDVLRRAQAELRAAAEAIRQMSAEDRAKAGVHLRHGEMTVADVIEVFIVAHAEDHLAQIHAALDAAQGGTGGLPA